jgi:UDP-glucose 4-epimerase
MSLLITGGAGFIGSHTCIELLNAGYEIVVIDSFINSKPEALNRVREITKKAFKIYEVDLRDRDGMESIFSENTFEAVIHFAGLKAVGESVQFPLRYYDNNITGTLVLCEIMQKFNVKRLVFSSSATVYGAPESVPITENSRLESTNPYGRTKLMIEEILRDLYISDNSWSIALLRYFNPIGAHQSGRIGEDPNGVPNNLLPYITQVAAGKLNELKIFGNDYQTFDGTGVRDYIHVVDLAVGHMRSLEKLMISSGVEAYNLGTGKGLSVFEIVRAFETAAGLKIPYRVVERRKGDIAICYADPLKAKISLGWTAEKGIEEMCADAWRWQLNNPNGYNVL